MQIRDLKAQLGAPLKTFSAPEIKFYIYRAKALYDSVWQSETHKEIVLQARKSYWRYGKVPLTDDYDNKAVVYLVLAEYFYGSCYLEEWASLRFIPGDGDPAGLEDLLLYQYRRKDMAHWVEEKLIKPRGLAWCNFAAGSKLCGFTPYPKYSVDEHNLDLLLPSSNQAMAVSFALMHRAFFDDCREMGLKMEYFIVQTHDKMIDGFMTVSRDDQKYQPAVTPARLTLGIKSTKGIRLRRTAYIYKYPLYFLDFAKVLSTLRFLLENKILTKEIMQRYLSGADSDEILAGGRINIECFSELGELFTLNGKIENSAITGGELRKKYLAKIPDGPSLRITEVAALERSINQMLGNK